LFLWEKPPVPVSRIAEKRGKTRRRIEPRKTKPINASVPAHQRSRLRIAKKRVVLDLCELLRHLVLLFLLVFLFAPALILDRFAPNPRASRSHHASTETPSTRPLALRRVCDKT